ncbi:MAG: hypothetical protein E7Z81_07285 [Methanobrevibacter sp.]|uniref:hypothetical protein n=1 Tax=Methanobrevibacter sp. TaxID=66852 RepID=UPI0025D40DFB|nr:hypothetical protein [Methanobrevibacter sp.]MBE6498063.1 hypothetical protein [Methanobrevibacter sp.]MBE6499352.1 hypothetical protein [Methanobrevibacter thaueri]
MAKKDKKQEDECLKNAKPLKPPEHTEFPFLTYGFFKPNQLAFNQIKHLTKKNVTPVYIEATLKHVNGMPVLIKEFNTWNEPIKGYVLKFRKKKGKTAYNYISNTKDMHIYSWETIKFKGEQVNVLVSANPKKMENLYKDPDLSPTARNSYDYNWLNDNVYRYTFKFLNSRLDELCSEIYYTQENDFDKLALLFMEAQSLYMVLWSAIDRFLTFRYTLRQGDNVKSLAKERYFKEALKECVDYTDTITSAQNLKQVTLNRNDPLCSAYYYYTLRNNIVHNGKENVKEVKKLVRALHDLTSIFDKVTVAVKKEGEKNLAEYSPGFDNDFEARKNKIKF